MQQPASQRFKLAFNHAGEIPRCLNTHMTGLVAQLNLRVDDSLEVVTNILAGIGQAADKHTLNPYALRSVLFNLSSSFLKAMTRIQSALSSDAQPPPSREHPQQIIDWGPDLQAPHVSPVWWSRRSSNPPLRVLYIMELYGWCQLNQILCELGFPGVASFATPVMGFIGFTRANIKVRQDNGELVLPIDQRGKPAANAKFSDKLLWALAPLESFYSAKFDESVAIVANRLVLQWGLREPNTFTKANFLTFLWSDVELAVSKAELDWSEVFLLTYMVVERFDVC